MFSFPPNSDGLSGYASSKYLAIFNDSPVQISPSSKTGTVLKPLWLINDLSENFT
jgi:hypothetical protein